MKRTIHYLRIAAVAALALAAACNPIEIRYDLADDNLTASDLEISAVVNTIGGQNGNVIVVENHSKVLSEWTLEDHSSSRAYDTFYAAHTGENTIHFRGLLAGGKFVEKDLSVQVDTISTVPEDIASRLCIGAEGAPDHFGTTFDKGLIGFSNEKNLISVWNGNPV